MAQQNATSNALKPRGPVPGLFPRLFRDLGSRSYHARTRAIANARALSPGEFCSLIGMADTRLRRRRLSPIRRRKLATLILPGVWIALAGLCFLLAPSSSLHGDCFTYMLLSAVVLGSFGFLSAAGCLPEGLTFASRLQTSLTLIAGDIQDARLLPFALSHLWNSSGFINTSVRDGVKQLLPKVRAEDAEFWNADQKRTLLKLLDPPYRDPELIVRVLKALEQIGDETALPAVQRLAIMQHRKQSAPLRRGANKGFSHRVWGQDDIRQAASECQAILEARALTAQQATTLLRATYQEDATAPETLLRSLAAQSEDTPAEQLLRPQ